MAAPAVGALLGNYVLIKLGIVLVLAFSLIPPLFIAEPRVLGATPEGAADASAMAEPGRADWGQLWRIYLANGFAWIGAQTMWVFVFAFIEQKLGTGSGEAGAQRAGEIIQVFTFVMQGMGFLLPAFALPRLVKRFGRVNMHRSCLAVMALGYLGIATLARNTWSLYLFTALAGVGWAAIVSLPFAIMTEKVDKRRMGYFMGIFNLSIVIPQLLVSALIGRWLSHAADKSLVFYVSAAALAISSVLWSLVQEGAQRGAVAGASDSSAKDQPVVMGSH